MHSNPYRGLISKKFWVVSGVRDYRPLVLDAQSAAYTVYHSPDQDARPI
jgi:hypothetical protein